MHREDTPLEIGLGKYCALDTDLEFIGKDALLRQRDQGITKQLMGLYIDGTPMTPVSMPLPCKKGSERVGSVTSGVYSPDLNHNIAFAMLDMSVAHVDTIIDVETLSGTLSAKVCNITDFSERLAS
jgi:glycine cleavage system aminomethyltransferase T